MPPTSREWTAYELMRQKRTGWANAYRTVTIVGEIAPS